MKINVSLLASSNHILCYFVSCCSLMKTWWHSDRSQWKKRWKKPDKFEHVVLSLIKVAIARTKKPDSNKIHSVVCKRWCSSDWKKRAIIPRLSPCKCQIIENDKILTFCNLSPQLTKKAILKLNDANLSPQKKNKTKFLTKQKTSQ